ncbi:MAG TPA: gamma-glutamyltransferase family protein [Candidatus Cybelea sp.]|jgi:gamma-glutamyltranspeptidase/glutathione hydrolase|nr:gamma-glutamyltransferase family protein [Candidatus Cybelea sp.]
MRSLALLVAVAFAISPVAVASADTALSGVTAQHAMVATAQRLATAAGVDVLRAGGNAVDAAVAVGYALAVVNPCCGNVGGGGFMLVRLHDGRERFLDFRERAPLRATRSMYLDANGNVRPGASTTGWLAVAVPGTVAGLERARAEFGTMSRAQLMAPAIALARDGFVFSAKDVPSFHNRVRAGELYRQPELAATLGLISRDGSDAFYRGPIAREIVSASDANGGILSMADFREYRIAENAPLHCRFQSYDVTTAPPPGGGTTLCEILNVIAPYPLRQWGWHDVRSIHYITEAERFAYADRNTYLGDPDFVRNPVAALLAPSYAARIRARIRPNRATPSVEVRPGLGAPANEGAETTHYSIVDRWGNAVAVTYTLNALYGAGVIAGNTGFFLNDEMDDFTSKPGVPNLYGLVQGEANAIAPGKRPLSSMTPTIVTQNGKLRMVTGSPGGSRIITIVLETLLNALVYGRSAQEAVAAPRTHMQWLPDVLQYESGALSDSSIERLRSMGYTLQTHVPWGSAQAIVIDPTTGVLEGGSDPRTPSGAAIGY